MKEIKENIKTVAWSALIAFILILLFSCNKQEAEFKNFEGEWAVTGISCKQYTNTLKIQFVKRVGSKSKHSNLYEVIGGQEVFGCKTNDSGKYFFSNFEFKSEKETATTGVAIDRDLQMEIVNSDILQITYIGGVKWEVHFKRVK